MLPKDHFSTLGFLSISFRSRVDLVRKILEKNRNRQNLKPAFSSHIRMKQAIGGKEKTPE
jgi:hypothetical protein